MTDPATTVQAGTGAATPTTQPSAPTTPQTGAAQEQAQEQAPQVVTMEALSQLLEERDAKIVARVKQSDRDRSKRIEGEIAGLRDLLSKTGVQLAPEQELKMREEIGARIDQVADEPQAPAGQASPEQGADQLIAQFVGDIFTEAGTVVTKADPEWKELQDVIDATFNDPKGHIKVTKAAFAAAEKKAQRMNSNSESAAARVVGTGGSNVTGTPADAPASDLWKQAYKK